MQKCVDDSELSKILKDAKQVMAGIGGKKEMDREQMLEMAQEIAKNTDSYARIDPGLVERSAREVKSRISTHIAMLKTTASNISLMKERIQKRPGLQKSSIPEVPLQLDPGSAQIGDYNRKIDEALKHLSAKTGGKTMIEQKVKKYREIMGDVEGALKELPKALKEGGKMRKLKPIDQKLINKVDLEAAEMLKKMQEEMPRESVGWKGEGYGEEEEGNGDWINYEGFNSQEQLDQYKEIFKGFVGEYPDEYERRNREEGYYDKDGMGRAIDRSKPGNARRRGLYSPPNKEKVEEERLKRCIEIEKNFRDSLSKSKENGDLLGEDLFSVRTFLDSYIEKKMDTIHTGEGFPLKEEMEKKENAQKIGKKKNKEEQTTEDGRLCMDGPSKKGTVESLGVKPRSSHAKSNKKSSVPPLSANSSNDKKQSGTSARPKTSSEKVGLGDSSVNWDMDRIRKLIVKERQEQLRKKREDWEKNNEVSEEVLEREKMMELKKIYKCSPFNAPIPDSKPSPSDFITNRDKHEKMYRKAALGKEGVYHKEDLDYEFGVSPYYFEPAKSKKEGGDSKDTAINIKSYRGVRKKAAS